MRRIHKDAAVWHIEQTENSFQATQVAAASNGCTVIRIDNIGNAGEPFRTKKGTVGAVPNGGGVFLHQGAVISVPDLEREIANIGCGLVLEEIEVQAPVRNQPTLVVEQAVA